MDTGTTLPVPGCEGGHAVHVARRRPGALVWFRKATGNGSGEGGAAIAAGPARSPRGSSYRRARPGPWARGKEPGCSQGCSKACGMADCLTATHGAAQVRTLQRALSRPSTQDQQKRLYSLDDQVGRADVLWAAWRQVKANQGAPGVDGMAIAWRINPGDEKERIPQRPAALRAHRSQCAPVRGGESPKPQGGTRPRGMATVEDRVVQTALTLVLEPIFAADVHDCSSGYRPQREAKHASMAMREDWSNRAWGVVAMECQAYCTSIPHRKLLTRSTRRIADGSLRKLSTQTLTVGAYGKGQVVATKLGGPQGAPLSSLYSNISLHLVDHLWQSRGSPEQRGAPLHRDADEALLVGRRSPQPVLAACEGIAKRRDWPLNRAQTRVTRVTEGCDVIGVTCVQRQSPRSGQQALSMCPATSAQQQMRHRLQYGRARRAPSRPKACVARVHPLGTGWANSVRHPNASQAFRGLQRCVTIRFRRSLPQRSTGRGFGGKRFPHRTRSAMGLVSMGSGLRESMAHPAHGVRGRLSDRRTRETCTDGGRGRAWCTDHERVSEARP